MSNYRFLSSIYSDATITAIIEEAINLSYKLTFIDLGTEQEYVLSKSNLAAVRDFGLRGKRVNITTEPPRTVSRYAGDWIGNVVRTESFGRWQSVGYSDLRADGATFEQIKKIFGDGDKKSPKAQLPSGANQPHEQIVDPNDEELDEEYYNNPADRDPRLFEEAVQIKIANPDWNLTQIHKEIHSKEKGKSNISIDLLKHIVQLKELNKAVKRRIAMEEKQKVRE